MLLIPIFIPHAHSYAATLDLQPLVDGTRDAVVMMSLPDGRVIGIGNPGISIGEAFALGSTAKLITVGVGLRDGAFTTSREDTCLGWYTPQSGDTLVCWLRRGHGVLDLRGALVNSCNVYVAKAARAVTFRQLRDAFVECGFGRGTGVDRSGENPGAVPSAPPAGGIATLAIGQSPELRATPLQMCAFAAAIAMDGEMVRPWFDSRPLGARGRLPFPPDVIEFLSDAMRRAVEQGTCAGLRMDELTVAAKTGTASWPDGYHTHGWCVGFAPADDPAVAFAAFVFEGEGATDAVPLAKKTLQLWLESR